MNTLPYAERVERVKQKALPLHVAIVPDGNGRWAQRRGLPRLAGHKAGVETIKSIVRAAGDLGIRFFTIFAFSTENWRRPEEEVEGLFLLIGQYLDRGLTEMVENGVRVRVIGRQQGLRPSVRAAAERAVRETTKGENMVLTVALNYGGRSEIVGAARTLAERVLDGQINLKDIDEACFARFLETDGLPDPDVIIRSSGESRISNFLLWQSAYSEFIISHVLWPDFTPEEFLNCIEEYQRRHRRFGSA